MSRKKINISELNLNKIGGRFACVRLSKKLNQDKRIDWYSVESENHESIHNNNAYSYIEKK